MRGSLQTVTWEPRAGDVAPFEIEVFVPARIEAADWVIPLTVAQATTQADAALARLQAQPDLVPLAPMLLREEGIASSRIEGLFLSTRRIYESQYARDAVDDRTAAQVLANIETLADVLESAGGQLRPSHFRGWHSRLMEAEGTPRVTPGQWRAEQNWIGGDAWTPRNAEFIPPPPGLVPELIDDLVEFCNRANVPPVLQAAIAHAQFETIHPFVDGNGRVGRALIYWVLRRRNTITLVPPAISPIFAADRNEYVAGLTAYRFGDVDQWLHQFARALTGAAAATTTLGEQLKELKQGWLAALGPTRSDSVALLILNGLPEHPILDPPTVTKRYRVSPQTAREGLVRLADSGILTEQPLRKAKRGRPARVFAARQIFELLDRPPIT